MKLFIVYTLHAGSAMQAAQHAGKPAHVKLRRMVQPGVPVQSASHVRFSTTPHEALNDGEDKGCGGGLGGIVPLMFFVNGSAGNP